MWLKMIFPAAVIALMMVACAPAGKTTRPARPEKIDLVQDNSDSTEYELIIIDPGFQTWFDSYHKPIWYYSNDFLATWNHQYVVAWNSKVRDIQLQQYDPNNPFLLEIDYRPSIDYGLDLNYKLYHYFRYVEATWGKILSFDRQN